jgi:DNA-binding NarL/FixJ family response regulator
VTAILIVDDHPMYREGLAATLRRGDPPIQVLSAATAAAGAAIL